jgi:hypothetical protein
MVAPTTTNQAFSPALSGPYLTASAAYAAGFRGWPLVVMTAIAGRETGWNNDPPHTDTNGISSTGLWQINSSNTTGLTDPVTNAQNAFSRAGGNTLAGLSAWALTPPGQTSLAGVTQPKPYPWGTVPPALWGQDNLGQQINYALTASQVAQAIYAYGQLQAHGPATSAEMQGAGWGTTGPQTIASAVSPGGSIADTSTSGNGGCNTKGNVFSEGGILGIGSLNFTYCQLKALKGGLLTFAGGAVMLFGGALIIVSGLAGKGPLAPVVSAASGYVAGAKRLPGIGGGAKAVESGPSEASVMRSDRATLKREGAKRETSTEDQGVNYKGGKPLRSVKDPWDGQGMAEDAA